MSQPLSPTAGALLTWMLNHLEPGQAIQHSNVQLAAYIDCSDRSIRRALRQLYKAGFVEYRTLPRYNSSGAGFRELVFTGRT
jgi:Mn-dependent DtxR family transcriptional regulator